MSVPLMGIKRRARLVDAALGVVLEPYAAALQRRARVHDGVQQRRGQPGQQAGVPRPACMRLGKP